MNKCTNCGTEYEGKFCPECGTALQKETTCPKCSTPLKEGAKFCSECGYSLMRPAPARSNETPARNDDSIRQTVIDTESKLYLFLCYLPALLLGLFAGLTFAFLAAPAATASLLGFTSSNTGYEILTDENMQTLQGSYIAFIVLACIALITALTLAYSMHTLWYPRASHAVVSGIIYLIVCISASIAIWQVNELDKNSGVLSVGACPILILVFALLFAVISIISVIVGNHVPSTVQKMIGVNMNEPRTPNKAIAWVKGHVGLVAFLSILLVGVIVIGSLIPTFILMSKNGTYYAYVNGEYNRTTYFKLENGTVTDQTGAKGTYEISGDTITIYARDEFLNTAKVVASGSVMDGVLKLKYNGKNYTFVTQNHTHSYGDWEESYAATCTTEGVQIRSCHCGKIGDTRRVAALGHTCDEWTVTLEPTCTEEGIRAKICSVCGAAAETEAIAALGHTCSSWSVTLEPTCTAEGTRTGICDVCGAAETKAIAALGHSCSNWTVILEPTCTEEGTQTGICDVCGEALSQPIPPTGHLQSENGVCLDCGAVQLEFTLNNGTYSVKASETGKNSVQIQIPAEYNSLPVTSIESSAFEGCKGLASITIPDSVTSISSYAFFGCNGLTSITIPDSVMSIGSHAFRGCSALTNVIIGNGVTSIGTYAFWGCSGLTSITIPDSITNIDAYTFYYCSGLTSIAIPNSVTSIGDNAFNHCSSLKDIYYNGTKENWNTISKGTVWNSSTGDYIVHCTDGDIIKASS